MRIHHRNADGTETVRDDPLYGFLTGGTGSNSDEDKRMHLLGAMPTAEQDSPEALFDPKYAAEQGTALDALAREVQFGGWTPEEMQHYQRQAAQSAGIAMGNRMGMAQQMIAKGLPPSVANQITQEVGQQQEAQAGYHAGTEAQQSANDRAYQAALQGSALAGGMQAQSVGEETFQKGQRLRGIFDRYADQARIQGDSQDRADLERSQNAEAGTQIGNAVLGMGGAVYGAERRRNSGAPGATGRGSGYGA